MSKKLTTTKFIKKARLIHGERYDYSLVEYKNAITKIKILCKKHGEFLQTSNNHLCGKGCPKCASIKNGIKRRNTTESFIKIASTKHHNKYDYSKTNYIRCDNPVIIICPTHGKFKQNPSNHLNGQGCKKCYYKNATKTTKEFIKKAKKIHKNKYDYSLTKYTKSNNKLIIICKKHGEFLKIPQSHLQGQGCPNCNNHHITTEKFIKRCVKIHKNKYDYSKVNYTSYENKVIIICPKHGEFSQTPDSHIHKHGCPKCSSSLRYSNTKIFSNKANIIHNNKYNYSKVKYKHSNKEIIIICPKHSNFLQKPSHHLIGRGCPLCSASKGENKIETWLSSNNIKFIPEKRFDTCKNKRTLPFDFFLPDHNLLIEYDGEQHFSYRINKRYTTKLINKIRHNDFIKNQFCIENHINLLRIPYTEFNRIDTILKGILNKPVPASNIIPFLFFNQSKTTTILEEAVS